MTETIENPNSYKPKIESKADLKLWVNLLKMSKFPTSIPGDYARNFDVSDGAVRFWLCLNIISNIDSESWWHQTTMANMFGISKESIKRYYRELVKAGWLEKYKMKKGKKYQNIKRLVWPDDCPSPRIKSAKNKAVKEAMEEKLDNSGRTANYRAGSSGGFSKAF